MHFMQAWRRGARESIGKFRLTEFDSGWSSRESLFRLEYEIVNLGFAVGEVGVRDFYESLGALPQYIGASGNGETVFVDIGLIRHSLSLGRKKKELVFLLKCRQYCEIHDETGVSITFG